MTVAVLISRVSYVGNGVTLAFPVPFTFDGAGDLVVVLETAGVEQVQALNSAYTVTGAGNPSGGQVLMVAAPGVGVQVRIKRRTARTQDMDYVPNDPFPAESHEAALDKLTRIAQEQDATLAQTVQLLEGDAGPIFLPASADRVGKFLAFDADGLPVATAGSGGGDSTLRTDLADDGGSALIGHNSGRLGELNQSVFARLSHHVNVMDFIDRADWAGLEAGTNTDDQSAAFAAAIATGKRVSVPAGTYYANIAITQNNTDLHGEAYRNTVLRPFDVAQPLVLLDGITRGAIIQRTAIRNMMLEGTTARSAPGIKVVGDADANGADYLDLEDLFLYRFSAGLDVDGRCIWNSLNRLHAVDCVDGFRIDTDQACNEWLWKSCIAEQNRRHGMFIRKTDVSVGGFLSWEFYGFDAEFNGTDLSQPIVYGVYCEGFENFKFAGLYLEDNGKNIVSGDSYAFRAGGQIGRLLSMDSVLVAGSENLILIDGEKKSGSIKNVRAFTLPGNTVAVTVAANYFNDEPKMDVDALSVFGGTVVYTADANQNYGARAIDYIATPGTSLNFTFGNALTVNTAGGAVSTSTLTGLQPGREIFIAAAGANAITLAAALMADGVAKVIPSNTAAMFRVGGHPVAGKLWAL
jgi:hypothetical protein